MTPELKRLAREAGVAAFCNGFLATGEDLERFAMLVEQRAMEKAAVICDDLVYRHWQAQECAAAIRSSAPRAGG